MRDRCEFCGSVGGDLFCVYAEYPLPSLLICPTCLFRHLRHSLDALAIAYAKEEIDIEAFSQVASDFILGGVR